MEIFSFSRNRVKLPSRNPWRVLVLALFVAAGGGVAPRAGADDIDPGDTTVGGESDLTRLREGAMLTDEPGTFQLVGKRLVFASEGDARQFVTLENLALERVMRLVQQAASPHTWVVSGTVTEYQGANFLLIERAVIRRAGDSKRTNP
jgi:hypothetical protein